MNRYKYPKDNQLVKSFYIPFLLLDLLFTTSVTCSHIKQPYRLIIRKLDF